MLHRVGGACLERVSLQVMRGTALQPEGTASAKLRAGLAWLRTSKGGTSVLGDGVSDGQRREREKWVIPGVTALPGEAMQGSMLM